MRLRSIPISMTPPLLLLLFASLVQLLAPATPSKLPSCKPKACGDLNIAYPFWLEEPGRPPCGLPSFQLKCNSSFAFLSHSFLGSYRVVRVFVENSSVRVVDENLPLATGCPAPWFNISTGLGLGPFVISKANTELLFLSNCNKSLPAVSTGFRPLPCANKSFVRLGGEGVFYSQRVHGGIPPGCLLSVVPILGSPDGNVHNYVASMNNGFLLEWAVVPGDCPKCMASGGECRYGDNGLVFSCNCADGLHLGSLLCPLKSSLVRLWPMHWSSSASAYNQQLGTRLIARATAELGCHRPTRRGQERQGYREIGFSFAIPP